MLGRTTRLYAAGHARGVGAAPTTSGAPSRAGSRIRVAQSVDGQGQTAKPYDLVPGALFIALSIMELIGPTSCVNSNGITNLVAGPAPRALRASRYCSAIVLESIPLAASKIVCNALLKPW